MRHTGGCVPSPFCVPAAPRHTGRRVKTAIHPMTNRRFFLIFGTYARASAVQMARAVLRGLRNDGKGGHHYRSFPQACAERRLRVCGLRRFSFQKAVCRRRIGAAARGGRPKAVLPTPVYRIFAFSAQKRKSIVQAKLKLYFLWS